MTSERAFDPVATTASNLGMDSSEVGQVVDEFLLQLHRDLVEYEGMNGDYLAEELWHRLSPQAYFHLLGFLERFAERYRWEAGSADEYLARLGSRAHWLPYAHQANGWVESSRYGRRAPPSKA
jgi:hypothetical protein